MLVRMNCSGLLHSRNLAQRQFTLISGIQDEYIEKTLRCSLLFLLKLLGPRKRNRCCLSIVKSVGLCVNKRMSECDCECESQERLLEKKNCICMTQRPFKELKCFK